MEVLWRGPVARILPVKRMAGAAGLPDDPSPLSEYALSPDGRWLATRSGSNRQVLLVSRERDPPRALPRQPDGRWIATADDESVRLWPMPDMSTPPLYTVPHDQLLAKLDALTNLRLVRDPSSSTGWSLEVGPFPGWETAPTW